MDAVVLLVMLMVGLVEMQTGTGMNANAAHLQGWARKETCTR